MTSKYITRRMVVEFFVRYVVENNPLIFFGYQSQFGGNFSSSHFQLIIS